MKISSNAFEEDQMIPGKYTCEGLNVNPQLRIEEVPDDAKSLALIVDDPDAPNATFTHWIMWNIDPKISEIEEGSSPVGVTEGKNSRGEKKYIGPCPPRGTHRYRFMLYALDKKLDINDNSVKGDLEEAMSGHIVEDVQLVGKYSKKSS